MEAKDPGNSYVRKLIGSMGKFGLTSLLGTAADFLSFTFLFLPILDIFYAEICAAFIGMIINFFMQKRFVFKMNRKVGPAFLLSVAFSFVLMFAGAFVLDAVVAIPFFATWPIIAKVMVMGCKFVLNYFTKKWVFEKAI